MTAGRSCPRGLCPVREARFGAKTEAPLVRAGFAFEDTRLAPAVISAHREWRPSIGSRNGTNVIVTNIQIACIHLIRLLRNEE
jgi:hypothetical protein